MSSITPESLRLFIGILNILLSFRRFDKNLMTRCGKSQTELKVQYCTSSSSLSHCPHRSSFRSCQTPLLHGFFRTPLKVYHICDCTFSKVIVFKNFNGHIPYLKEYLCPRMPDKSRLLSFFHYFLLNNMA